MSPIAAIVNPPSQGSRLHADHPSNGVLIPHRSTYRRRLQYRGLLFCRPPGSRCRDLIAGIGAAVVTVLLALIFAPDAAPVAYVTGAAGPLIGADLLHLERSSKRCRQGQYRSAGTFDGIVFSGIVTAYLA
jgi:hypothetical protein